MSDTPMKTGVTRVTTYTATDQKVFNEAVTKLSVGTMTATKIKEKYPDIANMRDRDGNTVLHALISEHTTTDLDISPLLEAGVDAYAENYDRKTALDLTTPYTMVNFHEQIARHDGKRISKLLGEVLGTVAEKGSITDKDKETFNEIKVSCAQLQGFSEKEKMLLAKHLGGIIREAAQDPKVNMKVRKTFGEWATDLKNSIFNRKEKAKVKEMIGYQDIVIAMRTKSEARNKSEANRTIQTLSHLGLIENKTDKGSLSK